MKPTPPAHPVDIPADHPDHGLNAIFNTPEADLALLQQYNLIKIMLETSQAVILILDCSGRIVFFNSFLEKLSGYSLEEVRGKEWFPLFLPQFNQPEIRALFQELLKRKDLHSRENPLLTRNGETKTIAWHNTTLWDSQGNACGIFSYGYDITEKVHAEVLLQIQRDVAQTLIATEQLSEACQNACNILSRLPWLDCVGVFSMYEGNRLLRIADYCLTPDLAAELTELPPDMPLRQYFDRSSAWYGPFSELKTFFKTDSPGACALKAAAIIPFIHNQSFIGSLFFASTAFQDIPVEARNALESIAAQLGSRVLQTRNTEHLRISEERYRDVIEISHDCIWELDIRGCYTYASQHIQDMLGVHPAELLGHHWTGTLTDKSKTQVEGTLHNLTSLPPAFHRLTTVHRNHHGSLVYLESTCSVALDESGHPLGARGSYRDITQHRRNEQLLHIQRDLAYHLAKMTDLSAGLLYVFDVLKEQTEEIDACAVLLGKSLPATPDFFVSSDFTRDEVVTLYEYTAQMNILLPKTQNLPHYFNYKSFEKSAIIPQHLDLMGAAILPIRNENTTIGSFFMASQTFHSLPQDLRNMLEMVCARLGGAIVVYQNRIRLEQEKEKYQRFFELASDSVLLIYNSKVLDCNQATLRMFRLESKQAIHQLQVYDFIPKNQPDGRPSQDMIKQRVEEAIQLGQVRFKATLRRRDGDRFPAELMLIPFLLDGETRMQVYIRDISVQVQSRRNLQRSLEIQASLYELISLSLEKQSLDEFLRHLASQFITLTWMGSLVNTAIFLTDPENRDILRFKTGFNLSNDQIHSLQHTDFNNFVSMHHEYFTLPVFACRDCAFTDILTLDSNHGVWLCPLLDSQDIFWGVVAFTAWLPQTFDAVSESFFFTAEQMIISMINRKFSEQTFQTEYVRMDYLINSIPSVIIAINKDNHITLWNHAAEKLFGISITNVLGQFFPECGIPWEWSATLKQIPHVLRSFKPLKFENIRFRRTDGSEGVLDILITPIRGSIHQFSEFLLVGIDRTEQKALETQLLHSQKMESIGQLAAGIAHEINTPIQYVGDNIRFLQDSFGDIFSLLDTFQEIQAKYRESMEVEDTRTLENAVVNYDLDYLLAEAPRAVLQSLEGVERVATIVKAMKGFAHPDGNRELVPSDINLGIRNTVTVSRNEWKYVAETSMDLDESMPLVPCLPGEINQVILNIIVNAAHAIEANHGAHPETKGKIEVSSKLNPPWSEIRIKDTGGGIPKTIRDRVFDPFFTTKEVGKGTGQGLAIARSVIIDKHKGELTFTVEENVGTTFLIRLPLKLTQEKPTDG